MAKFQLRSKPTKLELEHPVEGKTGWVLDLIGFDSVPVRQAIKEVAAKRAAQQDSDGRITVETLTADQIGDATISAAAIVGWNSEFAEADDSIGPYKPETALALMLDQEINWIREQVSICLRERANFFRGDSPKAD